jgi:hypothetical protein
LFPYITLIKVTKQNKYTILEPIENANVRHKFEGLAIANSKIYNETVVFPIGSPKGGNLTTLLLR